MRASEIKFPPACAVSAMVHSAEGRLTHASVMTLATTFCLLLPLLHGCKPNPNSSNPQQRARAISDPQFTNQSVLASFAINDPDASVRFAALDKLTDPASLARVTIEASDPVVARHALSMLDDPASLARVAIEAKVSLTSSLEEEVTVSAVMKLHDQDALAQVAADASFHNVRVIAAKKLTNQALLLRFATDENYWGEFPGIREAAIGNLTDQALLSRLSLGNEDFGVRLAALTNLTDQATLAKLAAGDGAPVIRKIATSKLFDQELLAKLASSEARSDYGVLLTSLQNLTNQTVLARLADEAKVGFVRDSALRNLTDTSLLASLAIRGKEPELRSAAVRRLSDQSVLGKVATDGPCDAREAAALRLLDQSLLVRIALTDAVWQVRKAAFTRLTNRTGLQKVITDSPDACIRKVASLELDGASTLLEFVQETTERDLRKLAFAKVGPSSLSTLAASANDASVRLAAELRLNMGRVQDALSQAIGGSISAGDLIEALTLLDREDSIADAVQRLCHAYIQKAEAARIPALVEMLNIYGTKSLAEDYLNCGQTELDRAARAWGAARGLSVDYRPGFTRVRWGQ